MTTMPAAFIGHGSPMNTLENNRYTDAWRRFGADIPRPAAVLVVSAHWYTNATAVTAMPWPRTIHDFYGFPDELFAVQYPAPGAPEFAERVAEIVKPRWVGLDVDSWGLDHGTWSVLVHMFPDADVPVLQLSINALQPLDYHLDLGRSLAPLREEGVLILTSGNIVHNLGAISWGKPSDGFDWARRFGEASRDVFASAPGEVLRLVEHQDYASAVPTPDHFIPAVYTAGLGEVAGAPTELLVGGYAYGSLSMDCHILGADCSGANSHDPAAAIPPPEGVPIDQSNI